MDEVSKYSSKILNSFSFLKRLLGERAECYEDEIVVHDEPLTVVIKKDRIDFYIYDVYHGSAGRDYSNLTDEVREEAKMWLQGLAMLKFKRFTVRR